MSDSLETSPIFDPDHDTEKDLDVEFLEPLYERNWLHDAEDYEEYRSGGFHPVHLGERFGTAGRFRVIHKLGRGGLATVWLCRDEEKQKYVGLKIIIADGSPEDSSELRLVNKGLDFGEAGGNFNAVPHEHFWHDGPNGRHLCLVLPVLGPWVTALWRKGRFPDPVKTPRDVACKSYVGCTFYIRTESVMVISAHLIFS